MSQFVLAAGSADYVINSAAPTGLRIYRVDVSWFPGNLGASPSPNGYLFLTRYTGHASGGTMLSLVSFEDSVTPASSALINPTTLGTSPVTVGRWVLMNVGLYTGTDWIDYGGFRSLDLRDNPVEVANGNSIEIGGNEGGEVNVYLEETA